MNGLCDTVIRKHQPSSHVDQASLIKKDESHDILDNLFLRGIEDTSRGKLGSVMLKILLSRSSVKFAYDIVT